MLELCLVKGLVVFAYKQSSWRRDTSLESTATRYLSRFLFKVPVNSTAVIALPISTPSPLNGNSSQSDSGRWHAASLVRGQDKSTGKWPLPAPEQSQTFCSSGPIGTNIYEHCRDLKTPGQERNSKWGIHLKGAADNSFQKPDTVRPVRSGIWGATPRDSFPIHLMWIMMLHLVGSDSITTAQSNGVKVRQRCRFRLSGWNSSWLGVAIPSDQMFISLGWRFGTDYPVWIQ